MDEHITVNLNILFLAYSIKIKKGWPIQKVFYPTNGTFFLQVEGGITQL